MKNSLIKEDLSFVSRIIRYLVELILSIKNLSYELGINRNVPKVLDLNKTISLVRKGKSIIRYGDGEFRIIKGYSIPYQKYSKDLQKRLKDLLSIKNQDTLICLPETFSSLKKYTFMESIFWRKYMTQNRNFIYGLISLNKTYGSSFFSRPYLRYKNHDNAENIFNEIKKIWYKKNILIIEGEGTRFGVGNNLLDATNSVIRIICPGINAFDKYKEIIKIAIKHKREIVLVALGPTAKPLVYGLAKEGVQAIDVGHLDIEYEWFIRKSKKRIAIPNKSVLEVSRYFVKKSKNKKYLKEIISVIK